MWADEQYGDTGFFAWLHSRLVGPYIGALGTEEQKARWLPDCVSGEDAAKAKLHANELEGRVTDECLQLRGGAGYMDEYPIGRRHADARISRIYAGSSEIMREIIARAIGLDPRRKER